MWFAKDRRPNVKAEHPGSTVGEIAKLLGEAWGQMTEAEKKPYAESQQKDRERYEREMADFRSGARGGGDEDEEDEEEYSDEAED